MRFGTYSEQGISAVPSRKPGASSTVSVMWQKIAHSVWCIEDADGLPMALATTLDDGTPLKVAEQWWAAARGVISASYDWLRQFPESSWPAAD